MVVSSHIETEKRLEPLKNFFHNVMPKLVYISTGTKMHKSISHHKGTHTHTKVS